MEIGHFSKAGPNFLPEIDNRLWMVLAIHQKHPSPYIIKSFVFPLKETIIEDACGGSSTNPHTLFHAVWERLEIFHRELHLMIDVF